MQVNCEESIVQPDPYNSRNMNQDHVIQSKIQEHQPQVGPSLSEYIWIYVIRIPEKFCPVEITLLSICLLDLKFAKFTEFFMVLHFWIKREVPVDG